MPDSPPISPPGLVFTHDGMEGYRRKRRGKGFSFHLPCGELLRDPEERRRILSLAVPPAYRSVWICMLPNGHLQATGIDDRGRKQYRYHPAWMEWSGERKFDHLLEFARALPEIRRAVRASLAGDRFSRERVVAGVVALLDRTGYRVGSPRYARENGSYGLATMLTRHVDPDDDGSVRIHFNGKSGKRHETEVNDPRLVRLIHELHELPGQHLFRYEDESGERHDLDSSEVNAWLKEKGGGDFSAKQFRTWRATVLCARELGREPPAGSRAARTRARNEAIKRTAAILHHRPATCRKYYVHPAIFRAYPGGELHRAINRRAPALRRRDGTCRLHADERRVFRLLERDSTSAA